MRKWVVVLLLLVAAVVVAVAALRPLLPRPTRPPLSVPEPRAQPGPSSPRQVVVAYLEALERKDLRAAYNHLSRQSREAHSYDEFVSLCDKTGVPSYDLAGAAEKPAEAGKQVTVAVPLAEDPAEAGFTTVKENGIWKVVFVSGAPSFPYP